MQNTHVLDTTAKLTKWRPRRDHDGKHAREELSCACLLMQIYLR